MEFGAVALPKRFWDKVRIDESGCWLWTANRNNKGYGVFLTGSKTDGTRRMSLAHRVMQSAISEIPKGMLVCHRCDVPSCVNPEHLFVGTSKDNTLDMLAKGREAKGSKNGNHTKPDRRPYGDRHGTRTHPERVARGDRRWTTRLTSAAAAEVKALYAAGGVTQHDLAERFGVHRNTINAVLNGRRDW